MFADDPAITQAIFKAVATSLSLPPSSPSPYLSLPPTT